MLKNQEKEVTRKRDKNVAAKVRLKPVRRKKDRKESVYPEHPEAKRNISPWLLA
jgi:hypothetical protein